MRRHKKLKSMDIPHIPEPYLDPDTESVDLALLAGRALSTYLPAPAMSVDDFFHIRWWGRTAIGEARDIVDRVQVQELDDEGRIKLDIPYPILSELDGGDVFYSYALDGPGGAVGEESKRLAFRVNRPVPAGLRLGVAQVRQSHDLKIAIEDLEDKDATAVTPPYQAMTAGDVLTLTWLGYFAEDDPFEPYVRSYTLKPEDVGRPVSWTLPYDQIAVLEDGFADLHYRIEYANGGFTESSVQRFDIPYSRPPSEPLLEAPRVKGHSGGSLDPDAFPDGIELIIPANAELRMGDVLIVYIEGVERVVYAARVDHTSLDSQFMAVIDRAWVSNVENFGKPFAISYQYARRHLDRHSHALGLVLRKPLVLSAPIVENSIPEGEENQGVVYPADLRSGATVRIPGNAEISGGEVKLIWQGHETLEFPVSVGDPRLFNVPPGTIPANLGKRVSLYYTVTLPDQWPQDSDPFDLRIADLGIGSFPPIQSMQVRGGKLSLAEVAESNTDALFTLRSWPFMAEGQRLRIVAEGVSQTAASWSMRDSDITRDEYQAGLASASLPLTFLSQLEVNTHFRISANVSFDGGRSFKSFRHIDILLIA
ncbi:hypothetical protein V7V80_17100 [Pseudomonas kermanshahensis]|uniref:Tip attachment protein J domain-containing protein n=1 Tax=Pseudomonas kermanshahensis TaxID=2745482 RepID=A0ABU8R961_9PSED|nr:MULTISPECIES: hypothetical protein [Pseudomonas]MBC3486264.1 hypothetical protein [Pseudomonas sp. SWRI50]MBC3498037.1 hypothetical protein [Pseudomonas sp. SWRI67]MBV4525568.1 hypothetical protein [Pseudomonas kermanshahensis]